MIPKPGTDQRIRERRVAILMAGDGDEGMSEADATATAAKETIEQILAQDGDHLAESDPELFDFDDEGDDDRQVYTRDDICERISKQVQGMSGKELIEFCTVHFGGENHSYDEAADEVEFDLE